MHISEQSKQCLLYNELLPGVNESCMIKLYAKVSSSLDDVTLKNVAKYQKQTF